MIRTTKHSNRKTMRRAEKAPLYERLHGLLVGLKVLALVALITGISWGVAATYQYLDVPVEVIAVQGNYSQISREELAQWVEPLMDGGMISLNLEVLRESLQRHPWIASASVSRQWPDGILIEVIEEEPIARWGVAGFLNSQGEALDIADNSGLQQLPLLSGPAGWEQQVMKRYQEVAMLLQSAGLHVDGIEMNQRGAWTVSLVDAPALLLGRDAVIDSGETKQKIQRFLAVWDRVLSDKAAQIVQVDLRYENGIAVLWQKPDVDVSAAQSFKNDNKLMVSRHPEQV